MGRNPGRRGRDDRAARVPADECTERVERRNRRVADLPVRGESLDGEAACVEWPDFDTDDQPFSLWLGATYTPVRAVDVGARVGFYRLDDGFDAFGATITAALRL